MPRRILFIPPKRLLKQIIISVIIGLIAVAAITGLVNTYRYDSEAKDRSTDTQVQLYNGCVRGNEFRDQVGDVARSVKNLDDYIVKITKRALDHPPLTITPEQLAQTMEFYNKFRQLSKDVKIPKKQACEKLYPKGVT